MTQKNTAGLTAPKTAGKTATEINARYSSNLKISIEQRNKNSVVLFVSENNYLVGVVTLAEVAKLARELSAEVAQ